MRILLILVVNIFLKNFDLLCNFLKYKLKFFSQLINLLLQIVHKDLHKFFLFEFENF